MSILKNKKRVAAGIIGAIMSVSALVSPIISAEESQYRLYKIYSDYNDYNGGKPAEFSRKYGGNEDDWLRWSSEAVEGRGNVLSISGNDIAKDCELGYELKDGIACGESFVMEFDMYSETGGALMSIVPENNDYASENPEPLAHFGFFVPFFIPTAAEGQDSVTIMGLTQALEKNRQTINCELWQNWKNAPKYTLGKWAHVKISSTELSSDGKGTLTLEIVQDGIKQTGMLTYKYLRDLSNRYPFDSLKRTTFRVDKDCIMKLDNLGIYTWSSLEEDESEFILSEVSYDYDTTGVSLDYSKNGGEVRKYGEKELPVIERKDSGTERGYILSVTGTSDKFTGTGLGYNVTTKTGKRISAGEEFIYEFDICSEKGGTSFGWSGSNSGSIGLFTPFYIPVGEQGDVVSVQGYREAAYNLNKDSNWTDYGVKYTIGEWAHVRMVCSEWTSDGKALITIYITDDNGVTTEGSMYVSFFGKNTDASKIFDKLYAITFRGFNGNIAFYDNMKLSRKVNVKDNMCGVTDASIKVENNKINAVLSLIKRETSEDRSINIIAAQYSGDILMGVSVENILLPAEVSGYAAEGGAVTTISVPIVEGASEAKVFALEEGTIYPIMNTLETGI